jgi:two-component system alkaline phosphatase synthesis response regulator PhoP
MSQKKKILICEDEPDLSSLLSSMITEAGFEAIVAKNGQAGLEKLKISTPDLILLDLLMPRVNGFEFLKYKNKFAAYRKIPVIVLSNLDQEENIQTARQFGVCDYLVKTDIHLTGLVQKIKEVLTKKKKMQLGKIQYY